MRKKLAPVQVKFITLLYRKNILMIVLFIFTDEILIFVLCPLGIGIALTLLLICIIGSICHFYKNRQSNK